MIPARKDVSPLKIFTPFRLIREHLNRKEFVIVENEDEADILWLYEHFR